MCLISLGGHPLLALAVQTIATFISQAPFRTHDHVKRLLSPHTYFFVSLRGRDSIKERIDSMICLPSLLPTRAAGIIFQQKLLCAQQINQNLYAFLIGFCFIQNVFTLCPLNSLIISSPVTQKPGNLHCFCDILFAWLINRATLHTIMHLLGHFLHQLHHQKDHLVLLESDECAS